MEGHMHEVGPLYTSVPYVTFDEGGWVVVWWGVLWFGAVVSSRGQSDGVRIVVSCHHESGLFMCMCLFACKTNKSTGVRGNLERVVLASSQNG